MLKEDSLEWKNISFEDFMKKSFFPLLRKVDDLETKLKKEQEGFIIFWRFEFYDLKIKEKEEMLNKICELEDQIENLNDLTRKLKEKDKKGHSPLAKNNLDGSDSEETWIFSCEKIENINSLKKALVMETERVIDLKSHVSNEDLLWKELLIKLEPGFYDPKGISRFRARITFLGQSLKKENDELTAKFTVSLCDSITKAWSEIEAFGQELLGRIAVVLECKKILELIKVQRSGFSNKKFECDYGLKLLKKMGWSEGNGLGKEEKGMTSCIQVSRREETLGLGIEKRDGFKWNDNWWENTFNNALQNIKIPNEHLGSAEDSSESEDEVRGRKLQKEEEKKKISGYSSSTERKKEVVMIPTKSISKKKK